MPSPVDYAVLTPPAGSTTSDKPVSHKLPLFLWLHGGGGDTGFLERNRALFEAAWSRSMTPPMVVVTPSAKRSFYLDYRDGSEKWETFILSELLSKLQKDYPIDTKRLFVGGVSMGGLGALRLAFKHPEIFSMVVALEPGIEPALAWQDVQPEDVFYRSEQILQQRFGNPIDPAYWAANNPATLAAVNAKKLTQAGLKIYLEVGTEDLFGLYRGAEFLHRVLTDNGVEHEYRTVLGGNHVGKSLPERIINALAFIGRMSQPSEPDPALERAQRLVRFMKKKAGVK